MQWRWVYRVLTAYLPIIPKVTLISFLLAAATTCLVQVGPSGISPQNNGVAAESEEERREEQLKKQKNQPVGPILPDFNVARVVHAVPVTPKHKFGSPFSDPGTFFLAGTVSGIARAQEGFPGYPQFRHVAILMPIAVGAVAVLCTIFIHALTLAATVNLFRYERKRGRVGAGLGIDLTILVLAIAFAFVAHLAEMAFWATLLVICGEFQHFEIAFYHSAGNYTTLGSGGILMTPSWRLLGPIEAANGALMFGVSTAMIFAVIVRLMQAHFADLRS
jgi:hypothetical protein